MRRRRRRAWTSGSTSMAASTGRWRSSSQRLLEPLGLLFIEEPLLSENLEGLRRHRATGHDPDRARRAALFSRWEFKPFFEQRRGRHHPARPQPCRRILEVRKIAAMAEAYDVAVAPHCPLGPLALGRLPADRGLHARTCDPGDQPRHPLQHRRPRPAELLHQQGGADARSTAICPFRKDRGSASTSTRPAVREADKDRHRWRNPIWRTATAVSRNGDRTSEIGRCAPAERLV